MPTRNSVGVATRTPGLSPSRNSPRLGSRARVARTSSRRTGTFVGYASPHNTYRYGRCWSYGWGWNNNWCCNSWGLGFGWGNHPFGRGWATRWIRARRWAR